MTTIYILLPLSRGIYNIYANANEQHINHIRCENILLYFFSRNRTTILKQVLIQSTARILHSKLIKSKQSSLGTNKKRKPKRDLYKSIQTRSSGVFQHLSFFVRLQNFNLQKCKYFSRNVEHIRSFYSFEKDLLTLITKMSTRKNTLFVFSFMFACLGSCSFTRVMRLVCTCFCHPTFCICICICLYLFDFACLGSGSIGKVVSLVCCHRHHRHTQVYPEEKNIKNHKNLQIWIQ